MIIPKSIRVKHTIIEHNGTKSAIHAGKGTTMINHPIGNTYTLDSQFFPRMDYEKFEGSASNPLLRLLVPSPLVCHPLKLYPGAPIRRIRRTFHSRHQQQKRRGIRPPPPQTPTRSLLRPSFIPGSLGSLESQQLCRHPDKCARLHSNQLRLAKLKGRVRGYTGYYVRPWAIHWAKVVVCSYYGKWRVCVRISELGMRAV